MSHSTRQVWFVTGSSRGLGRALVEEALAAGHLVAATARTTAALGVLADAHAEALLVLPLDVTDPVRAEEAVGEALRHFGRIDVVVNNAGYADLASIEDTSLDAFRAQVDAVFFGTVHVTKAVLPHFRERGAGHVIQIASSGGRTTAPGVGAYQSAKFAVEGFSGVLHHETRDLGIKVTVAEPGLMRTDWAGSSMRIPPITPAYARTVGAMAERLRASNGREPIDPARVARVLLDVARMDEPPFHLPLGSYTVARLREEQESLVEEDARWAEVGRSVDFA